jgi:septum formation protein
VDSCAVRFFPISQQEIEAYVATAEPYDKAGAYAIQGRAALWLDRLEGDYYTIMGLPVSRTAQLVEKMKKIDEK